MPVFMLTFFRSENIPKIYEIIDITGMRVEVTPYRKRNCYPSVKTARGGDTPNPIVIKNPDATNVLGNTPH